MVSVPLSLMMVSDDSISDGGVVSAADSSPARLNVALAFSRTQSAELFSI
jgi:hypothetical protein